MMIAQCNLQTILANPKSAIVTPRNAPNDIAKATLLDEQQYDPDTFKILKDINSNLIPKFKNYYILCDSQGSCSVILILTSQTMTKSLFST